MIVRVLRAARELQVLRILPVDQDADRGGLTPLDPPVAPLARRVNDGNGFARGRGFERLIDGHGGKRPVRRAECEVREKEGCNQSAGHFSLLWLTGRGTG